MNQKTLAILTYIDDTPVMVDEFSWLYKSWIYSGNWRNSDIVAVCNPAVISKLPKDDNVTYIPKVPENKPGSRWENYAYINSIKCVIGDHTAYLAAKYSHIIRTDADVFLTSVLSSMRPGFFVYGRGRYVQIPETRKILEEVATKHGIQHQGIFNVGSTILGPSAGVLEFIADQYAMSEILLDEFGDNQGEWPRWWRGTITMYAGELAANSKYFKFLYGAYLNVLDYESYFNHDIERSRIAHIHAFHNKDYWSKFVYREGGYKDRDNSSLNIKNVSDYCQWITSTPLETIKAVSGYEVSTAFPPTLQGM